MAEEDNKKVRETWEQSKEAKMAKEFRLIKTGKDSFQSINQMFKKGLKDAKK